MPGGMVNFINSAFRLHMHDRSMLAVYLFVGLSERLRRKKIWMFRQNSTFQNLYLPVVCSGKNSKFQPVMCYLFLNRCSTGFNRSWNNCCCTIWKRYFGQRYFILNLYSIGSTGKKLSSTRNIEVVLLGRKLFSSD